MHLSMHVVVFFFGNMVDTKKKNMILNLACQFSPDIISYLWVCSLAWLHNVTHTVHSLILRNKKTNGFVFRLDVFKSAVCFHKSQKIIGPNYRWVITKHSLPYFTCLERGFYCAHWVKEACKTWRKIKLSAVDDLKWFCNLVFSIIVIREDFLTNVRA